MELIYKDTSMVQRTTLLSLSYSNETDWLVLENTIQRSIVAFTERQFEEMIVAYQKWKENR